VNIPKNVVVVAVAAGAVLIATSGTASAATPLRSVAPVLSASCTAPIDCGVDVLLGSATASSQGPGTATVTVGPGAALSSVTSSTVGSGTAQSSVSGGSLYNTVSSKTVGSGSSSANVIGSVNAASAVSNSGGTAIAGALSPNVVGNFNADAAEARNGGRAVAGQNELSGQSGDANTFNSNTAYADGAGARAGAGQIGFGNRRQKLHDQHMTQVRHVGFGRRR